MKNRRGFTLIEILVAVALLAIIGVGLLAALAASSKSVFLTDDRQTAKTLAQHQMEYIKSLTYSPSYTPAPIPSEYAGYTVDDPITAVTIPNRDSNIQEIDITIRHDGKPIIMAPNCTLQGYKVNR